MLADILNFTFTPESGKIAGQRSGEVRRERSHHRKTFDKPPPVNAVQVALNGQLKIVAEEIDHTRDILLDKHSFFCPACERGGIEPHHRAQLLKALDVLLDRQRKLLGVSNPGPRRPERIFPGRNLVNLVPTPQPVVSSVSEVNVSQPQSLPPVQPTDGATLT